MHTPSYAYLLGLYLGDGCVSVTGSRVVVRIALDLRYLSADIRGLFCSTCDALGVRWTLSNPRNVSVSHRGSVAVLDAIGCAKD